MNALRSPIRYLVVNGDDFGQSAGVNRGIIESHERGILTSASLMVRFPAAVEAGNYASAHTTLSVGLHLDLGEWIYRQDEWQPLYHVVDTSDAVAVEQELTRQLDRFVDLVGREPTHLDSHQHVHLKEPVRAVALEAAGRLGIPLRRCTPAINYCGDFYGQTTEGAPYHEVLSIAGLHQVLARLGPGHHELGCHPGFADGLVSMYLEERALEVAVLCNPDALAVVAAAGFELRSFNNVGSSDISLPR